jgi:CelD/BcsL family acetyltransferase involved in cellulose biosynthesis
MSSAHERPTASTRIEVETILDPARLEDLRGDWDALAVACGQPMSSPAWLLAWLRHAAGSDVAIRIVVVREDGVVRGIAPFFVHRHGGRIDYRLMGQAYPRTSPLAAPGEEGRVAASISRALSQASPLPGPAIAVQLCASAGGETMLLNTGWDESFGHHSPVALLSVYALEDALARGDRRIDLAPGTQAYKQRFADADYPVAWSLLMVPSRRLPMTFARTLPMIASRRSRDLAKDVLPGGAIARLRTVRARIQRRDG